MNAKIMSSWAGLLSILWMLGGYALLAFVASAHDLHFEPMWLFMLITLSAWLGIGLFLVVAGLRRGNLAGRVCAVVGLVVFLYFAWQMVSPVFIRPHERAMRSNKSLQATRDGALSSASRFTLVGPACLSSGR
jgi:hypothetical protein